MRTAGIICECDPLHAGHLRLVQAARNAGADCVVGVMSACFVQRGDIAVAEPYARAEALVACGFDAVLTLPFPYSSASAEIFGRAGVEILSRMGVDEIWFGSECGDIRLLQRAAAIAESATFQAEYAKNEERRGTGTAKGYFELLAKHLGEDSPALASNDILALSYLRAILQLGAAIEPHTLRREGDAYRENALTGAEFPSATALRNAWRENGLDAIRPSLPSESYRILAREEAAGRAPASLSRLGAVILAKLRTASPEALEGIAELGGGLGARLASVADETATLEELLARAATKKYPDARIRRGLLFALCDVTWEDLRRPIAYARLLSANEVGCGFLASVRKSTELPIVTKYADLPHTPEAAAQLSMEERAWSLFALASPVPQAPYLQRKRSALIMGAKSEKAKKIQKNEKSP